MAQVTVKFVKVRDTKNATLFDEQIEGGVQKVGSLYVKKATFGDAQPTEITATIEWK